MDELEYIVTGALTHCNKGMGVMPINVTSNTTAHVQKLLVATEQDKTYMVNIPNYGMCATSQKPCHPIPTFWSDTFEPVKVNGSHPLIGKSCLHCAVDPSSKIEFITSGQLPLSVCLPAESLEKINEANKAANEASDEYDLERRSVGEAGFWEGFIPVWGSGRDYIHSIETKHYWKAAGNLGLVVLDVFTLGADELIIGAIKGGGKGLLEAGGKVALKKIAAVMATKEAAILLIKKAAVNISELSLKKLGLCIAKACFMAGTPVQTRYGAKNIEDIISGDEVWAYNEQTGETSLKPVLNVFEHQTDTVVELTIDGEVINTTPEHPFYTNSAWKAAGLLKVGDTIQLFNGKAALVQQIIFKFDEELRPIIVSKGVDKSKGSLLTTVYNIEVEGWHTYFIGLLWLLVHNAVCLYILAKEGVEYAQNILRGIKFNKIMAERMADGVHEIWLKGMKTRLDSFWRGKIISRKATQLATISEETAIKYIDEIAKKYKSGSTVQNAKRVGKGKIEGEYVLQVPKQESPIPKKVLDYAKKKKVRIDEIEDVTMDKLKNW